MTDQDPYNGAAHLVTPEMETTARYHLALILTEAGYTEAQVRVELAKLTENMEALNRGQEPPHMGLGVGGVS